MAKISPISIKYMIRASFSAEGALEKPDVIGALFGQTEGLLGSDLEMRELQKEGKIGRIEVNLRKEGKNTIGEIQIPTALDQSETTLIGAAIETIERIGPSEAQIEVEKIEDVRGTKRDYIIERAKKLMGEISGSADSREISNTIKDSAKVSGIQDYGKDNLPAGDLSGKEIIIVEGRADVVNLMRNGIKNVIGMAGTKLSDTIKELSKDKETTLFVDGDRGGRLIIKNVTENVDINFVTIAPDGKEVEELTGKEIFMCLRKKAPVKEFFSKHKFSKKSYDKQERKSMRDVDEDKKEFVEEKPEPKKEVKKKMKLVGSDKEKLKKISSQVEKEKVILIDEDFKIIKETSVRSAASLLKRTRERPFAIVVNGTATSSIIKAAEHAECRVLVAKNFATTDAKMELVGL